MTTALAKQEGTSLLTFSKEEKDLIRNTFGPTLNEEEFALFMYTSQAVGLNPLKRQIYAVKRKQWDPETRSYTMRMTIQTGIDGFRAVSFRNQGTIPGKEPTFKYTGTKTPANPACLESATAYLKVWGDDKQYHEVSATAYWDEYVPLNKEGKPQAMWGKMPRTMLAKCAEALLHRKCNPEQLSGIYTTEEMNQADAEKRAIDVEVVEEHVEESTRAIGPVVEEAIRATNGPVEEDTQENPDAMQEVIENDIKTVKEVFPEAEVKKVQKKGKFGFLDEVAVLKTKLRKLNGNDEEYYQVLGLIGPGSYSHANEINDRPEQILFWKTLKKVLAEKEERSQ